MEIIKSVPKNIQLSEDLSHQIPWSTEPSLHPELPQGLLKVNRYGSWGLVCVDADDKCLCCSVIGSALGKCQFVVDTAPLWS